MARREIPDSSLVAGCPIEVAGPFELGCGVPVPGFVKETTANVVPYQCFALSCPGQLQCLFLNGCRFVPPVAALLDLGQYQRRVKPVLRLCE